VGVKFQPTSAGLKNATLQIPVERSGHAHRFRDIERDGIERRDAP
jgi:hypothetical protein